MDRIVREQALKLRKTNQDKQNLNFWRFIMRSPITKLAIAAVVLIAAGLAIYYFAGEGTRKCCAWERIADKVEQIKTCAYRLHVRQTGGPLGQTGQQVEGPRCISHPTTATEWKHSLNGIPMQQMYMNPGEKAMIIVMPAQKKYMRMATDG